MKDNNILNSWNRSPRYRITLLKGIFTAPEKKLYSLGILSPKSLCLPDFLIIGAQKAGTTWLKRNLDHHPDIYMPNMLNTSDPTEVRYFDKYFYESLRSYSSLFQPAGMQKVKGEKSPNYCTLPLERVRFIRSIMPDVRLILMIRNPIERAWSHAIMNLVKLSAKKIDEISDSKFRRHFIRSKDRSNYPLILERWLSVFPQKQLYVGFFEDITECPKKLLSEVFTHLGVSQAVDWDSFPYQRVINKGPKAPIPQQHKSFLEMMYAREIETLYNRFGSRVESWRCLSPASE
jgi:Sulfotransferase family